MAIIKPFKGYCPNSEIAKYVSSPPYDVMSSDEARDMVKNNPDSFLRVIKPEIDFQINKEPNGDTLHKHGSKNLQNLINKRKIKQDSSPCFYLYSISMGDHTQTGIMAAVSIEEYNTGKIKKHEFTRPEKEDDRTNHIDIINGNTGPVFLTFKNDGEFQSTTKSYIINKPDISIIADDNTKHTLWKIKNTDQISNLKNYFKNISELYIADGHHRAASASRVQKIREEQNPNHTGEETYNYFLSAIFPHDEMQILDYNRLIRDLNGLTKRQLLKKIETNFYITPISSRQQPTNYRKFSMLLNDVWYKLETKNNIKPDGPVDSLDASILQNYILNPILGIDNPRTNDRIDFVGGIRGLQELERRCTIDAKIAFALYPVSINDLISVADSGDVMPPKSTWFEPKLRSGLVVRLFN